MYKTCPIQLCVKHDWGEEGDVSVYLLRNIFAVSDVKSSRIHQGRQAVLTFRHRASCILGQAFHYSPENAFYIFNQQIYFIT